MELALLLLPLLALAGLRYVPEDTALTVHRFGRYARTLSPGLRFTVPVLDRIAHRVRLVGHQVEIPVRGESSARAAVYYQILEPQRAVVRSETGACELHHRDIALLYASGD